MPNRTVEEKGGSYIQGEGTLQVNGDRVIITIGDRQFTDIDKASLPEGVTSGEKYSFRLSGDGTELYSIRPVEGSVVVVFDRFAAQKDMPPSPKIQKGGPREYNGRKWVAEDKLVFTAMLKIVNKKYKGMEIPYTLDYTFRQYENTNDTVIPYGRKNAQKTFDFLKFFGWDEEKDEIPWSDNVLPFLEKLLKSKDAKILATVRKGFIDSLSPFDPEMLL